MPKFISKVHKLSENPTGGMGTCGTTVWIPQDKAAMVHRCAEASTQLIDPKTNKPYFSLPKQRDVLIKEMKDLEKVESKKIAF